MAYTDIDDPSAYFTTTLWTGDGTSSGRSITNDANAGDFKPDWLWIKPRAGTNATHHQIYDSSRGVSKSLRSSDTSSEISSSAYGHVSAFDTNGFTSIAGSNNNENLNENSSTFVAWQWKANGGTATATISESGNNPVAVVQANPTAGFSIISYTGTGSSGTIAHGLGAIPEMYWIKNRDSSTPFEVFTNVITSTENSVLALNTTAAKVNSGVTLPTSTNITVTSGINQNQDGQKYIMYVFKNIQGYSKIGSYIGNGNANGTFVYTGFEPAWIMVKLSSADGNSWQIVDNKRNPLNTGNGKRIFPNNTNAESSSDSEGFDFLSNGFKLRNGSGGGNTNAATYIYMAFAESPFVSSEGVPTTAR